MRYFLSVISLWAWALWLGATIATFVFGLGFFHRFADDPATAGRAASAMFLVFGKYELVLAGVALACTSLRLVSYPSGRVLPWMGVLILAGGMAMTFAMGMTPRMESLREQGKAHSQEFVKMHGRSMILMTLQSVVLLIGGPVFLYSEREGRRIIVQSDSRD